VTRVRRRLSAPRETVYRALLDPPADNELGWQISLAKLAALVEAGAH
jgi:hypothetical protein